jgi:hypothetical protein
MSRTNANPSAGDAGARQTLSGSSKSATNSRPALSEQDRRRGGRSPRRKGDRGEREILNKLRAVSVRPPKRQSSPPAIHFDKKLTLDQIIDTARPMVADATCSTKQRIRKPWAAAKASRACGASDVIHRAFMNLAVEASLIDRRGHWTGNDVRADVRRHGTEDVAHVITWALRGWNPFETGPLK